MPADRRRGRLARISALLAATLAVAGCADWPNGLPVSIVITNWTSAPITVTREVNGGDVVPVVSDVRPFSRGVRDTNEADPACRQGTYVARDADGKEIARIESPWCDGWLVATNPIRYSFENRTGKPITLEYAASPTVVIADDLDDGKDVSGTIDSLGDPARVCGGFSEIRLTIGDGAAESFRPSDCRGWTWTIREVSEAEAEDAALAWLLAGETADTTVLATRSESRASRNGAWNVHGGAELIVPWLGGAASLVCFEVDVDQATGFVTVGGTGGPAPKTSIKDTVARCP